MHTVRATTLFLLVYLQSTLSACFVDCDNCLWSSGGVVLSAELYILIFMQISYCSVIGRRLFYKGRLVVLSAKDSANH